MPVNKELSRKRREKANKLFHGDKKKSSIQIFFHPIESRKKLFSGYEIEEISHLEISMLASIPRSEEVMV